MAKSRFAPTFLSLCALSCLTTQLAPAQGFVPLQAELVQRLDASRVKIGDSILGKVEVAWKSANCDLRPGAIVQGRVVTQKAHSKADKTSQIGVAFESGQCNGREMQPLFLTIAAIVAPTRDSDQDELGVEHLQPLTSAVGVMVGSSLAQNGNAMRSVSQSADTVFYQPRPEKIPDKLKPGQVVGIPHLALAVGEGDDGASVLYSTGHNVQLSPGTTFVLVPNLSAGSAVANVAASSEYVTSDAEPLSPLASAKAAAPDRSSELANETEVCNASDCSVVPAEAPLDEGRHGAQMTLQLAGLGYLSPAPNREMTGFAYDAGIAYLGPSQLLFTFNPHTLVPRSGDEATTFRKLHLVRAVLMSLEKKEVVKTVDWRIPDAGRYLWPVGKDQLLVHVGQELRLYGPGLKMIDQVFLGGQLAFVRVSPSSEYFAVGVIHERHTREIHIQLEEAELREPEEDVEIRLYNSHFKVLSTVTRSSRIAPPILMNEGEVDIFSAGRHRWRILETSWAGQWRVLSVAASTCQPQGDSLPGNLLYVFGCDRQTGDKWYRILHGDGKLILKGWSTSSELVQTAGGNVSDHAFAIRIAEAAKSQPAVTVFKPADLKSARVAIYSATNGRRIFSLALPDPVPTVQTFAISPEEDQLAILTASEIAFYRFSAN